MLQLKIALRIFICLCLVNSSELLAQMDLSWKEWKESDGLLSNYTYSMEPTEEGLLWIGTENGVSIFDGFRMRDLSSPNDTVKFDSPTYFLKRSGKLMWMATRSGIKIYDLESNKFLEVEIGEQKTTEDIYFLNDKLVLVSYYLGFYEIHLDANGLPTSVKDHSLSDLMELGGIIVNEFYLDHQGYLYISVAGYGVLRGKEDQIDQWTSYTLLNNAGKPDNKTFKTVYFYC